MIYVVFRGLTSGYLVFWESRKRAELVQWNGTGGVIVAIHV